MTAVRIAHSSLEERRAAGRAARERTPPGSSAGWRPAVNRPDPVDLLVAQDADREPDLLPVRHGRMMASPFTFYRGAATVMAEDLGPTPTAGLAVQLCGDAHLSNFGVYASPERRLVFDLNDFDETLPGPFEYDVKRLAASIIIAARHNGFSAADARAATAAGVSSYREAMAGFAGMRTLDVWYAHLSEDELLAAVRSTVAAALDDLERSDRAGTGGKRAKGGKNRAGGKKGGGKASQGPDRREAKELEKALARAEKATAKAHERDSLQALAKLGEQVDGRYRIVSQPPLVVPARDLAATYGIAPEEIDQTVRDQFRDYRATLQHDRRRLLERFEIIDMARKVVGVGSVGTRAFIVLLQGRDSGDPLFLQVKEATSSVLERHLPASRYRLHGERVVQGQRLMQATSDIFLGWTRGADATRHFYWRQLRDMKASADVESMTPTGLTFYGRMCGWTLARAHARSGDPVALAEYLGQGDGFDAAVTDFAERYADQNERDHEQFVAAVRQGRLTAVENL